MIFFGIVLWLVVVPLPLAMIVLSAHYWSEDQDLPWYSWAAFIVVNTAALLVGLWRTLQLIAYVAQPYVR
jgi:hypothetical protein